MYGKIFDCCFTGSMMGAGADVFAVWSYALANVKSYNNNKIGQVELNPSYLAVLIGMTSERVEAAIAFLTSPDKYSRSPEEEGRRLIHQTAFTYEVVNFAKYNEIRHREERREYQRNWDRENRRKNKLSESDSIRHETTNPTNTTTDTSTDIINTRPIKKRLARLTDENWIQSLKSNPAYKHLDLQAELGKMDAWLSARPGRKKTRRFIVNWLNNVDKPLDMEKVDPLAI